MKMLSKYIVEYEWHKKTKKQKPIYVALTKDKFSLPVAVADSIPELAKMIGVSSEYIRSEIKKNRTHPKFEVVWIDKEENYG